MSLVIHLWIWDVQDSHGLSASEMAYIMSGWGVKLYPLTHALRYSLPLGYFSVGLLVSYS